MARNVEMGREQGASDEYRRFFDLSVDLLWIMSEEGRFIDVNRAWQRLLGHDRSWYEERSFLDVVHEADRGEVGDAMARARRHKVVDQVETRFLTKDGGVRWFVWSAAADPEDGRVYGTAHDHTEKRRTEEELRKTEARSRVIVEGANEAIVSFGPDHRITYANPAAERMFGVSERHLVGQEFIQVIPEERRKAYLEEMEAYAKSGESPIVGPTVELDGLREDGTVFPIEMNISHWRGKEEDRFTAIIRDITERREAEEKMHEASEKMRRSNKELEQFAYIASHDLQEPLGVVRSYAQLMGRRLDPTKDPKLERYITFITDGTERMQRLLQDLLSYSRVETRGEPPRPVDTDRVFHEALERVTDLLEKAGAKVTWEPLPEVEADPDQLTQVFESLLMNAVKFRDERPPSIKVWSEPADDADMVEFHVRDRGIGIDPEQHDRVFQIFQRLHARDEFEGTGIGLAISKKIVERHGGTMGVDSSLGAGSTFWFTMPRVEAPQQGPTWAE